MFQIIKEIFVFLCRGQYNCNLTCFCSVDIWNYRPVEPSHIYLLTNGGITELTNYSDGSFPMNILIYITDLKIKQNPLQVKRKLNMPYSRRCRHQKMPSLAYVPIKRCRHQDRSPSKAVIIRRCRHMEMSRQQRSLSGDSAIRRYCQQETPPSGDVSNRRPCYKKMPAMPSCTLYSAFKVEQSNSKILECNVNSRENRLGLFIFGQC